MTFAQVMHGLVGGAALLAIGTAGCGKPADGTTVILSPEESIAMQVAIGSDIMMVLDQCIPSTAERTVAQSAMALTHRWAERSLRARGRSRQALFGIVQGACFADLRRESADFLTQLPFDGFAIGGLAVGESKEQREEFTALVAERLPADRPRYLMGVGTPLDILEAVHRGVDMFDCILPAQVAQRGTAFTSVGRLQLRREKYRLQDEPLDPACDCATCRQHSRAYLQHLHKVGDAFGWRLLTVHNLAFYHRLMREIRAAILEGTFAAFYRRQREALAVSDNTEREASRPRPAAVPRLGDYEMMLNPLGHASIRQRSSGEIMHSVSDPMTEARCLYVEQSRLAERLQEDGKELVIWDVGLGAATNAMAAVRCYETAGGRRALRLISFERDLDSLRLVLGRHAFFPHVHHRAPHLLLREGSWYEGGLRWELWQGDFRETLETAPPPDLIFYDPFSSKTDGELWRLETFVRVRERCSGYTELFTYSASTAVRAALLGAGFFVGRGVGTGPKEETTIAFSRHPGREARLLDERWLQRWGRSGARYPAGIPPTAREAFGRSILAHPQFAPVVEAAGGRP